MRDLYLCIYEGFRDSTYYMGLYHSIARSDPRDPSRAFYLGGRGKDPIRKDIFVKLKRKLHD